MYTRWNMTFFLFFGLTGLGFLLYISAKLANRNAIERRPLSAVAASVFAALALCAALWGINDISRMVNILGRPFSGFSSAIIGQMAALIMGCVIFVKSYDKNSPKLLSGVLGILFSVCSAYTLFRSYMISTRPGIDTLFLFVLLMLLILLMSCILFTLDKAPAKRTVAVCLAVSILCGAALVIFVLRLRGLDPQDRVLSFDDVTIGRYKLLFWGAFICSFVVPAAISTIMLVRRRYFSYIKFCVPVYWAGVFLLSMLINQMPVIQNGVNNRIFF